MSQQVTISATNLRRLADLLENTSHLMRELSEGKNGGFTISTSELKRPKHVSADDAWFWSEDWQKGEREVNQALKRGEYSEFRTVEELIADLHAHV